MFHDGLSAYHGFTWTKVRKNITVSKNFPAAPPTIFQLSHSRLIYSFLQACFRFASSVFPQFASSVFPVRFKRASGFASSVLPVRFKRGGNESLCRVKHHCRRLTLNRMSIAVESPRDCGRTASHRETFFSFSKGGRDPHASHRRTVAPSHKAGSDMRRGNGRK